MKIKKNILCQFFSVIIFLFFLTGIACANNKQWKENERKFFYSDKDWVAKEQNKKSPFFKKDSAFFEKDIKWKDKDNSWQNKDREWIKEEQVPVKY